MTNRNQNTANYGNSILMCFGMEHRSGVEVEQIIFFYY